jgi:hypothetical protein
MMQIWSRIGLCAFLLAGVALVAPSEALAQLQSGNLRGRVVDESGQAVPGVTVSLRDTERGTQRLTTSDGEGVFQFLAVAVGNNYELTAELSGFQKAVITGIVVNPGFTQAFDLKLAVATLQEQVTVVADKPLIDTTTTEATTTVDGNFIQELPLITRNYTEVIPQLPGVSWNRGGRLTFYQFNIHGAEIWGNGYRIDGASNMWSANRAGFLLVPSAIERMEIIAGGIPAEYGEQYGGIIKITTKTGANKVSGFAKSILRPNAFLSNQHTGIASQVQDKPPGRTQINEFALGGAIKPDRWWHFGAVQWIDEQQGSVLTLAEPVELDFYSFHEKITWQQTRDTRWDMSLSGSPHWARNRPPDITTAADAKFTQHTPGMNFFHALTTHVFNDRNFLESSFSFYHLELFTQTVRGRENVRPDEIRLRSWNPQLGFLYTTGPSPTYGRSFNLRPRYSMRFFRNTANHTVKTGIDYTEQFGTSFSSRFVKTVDDLRGRPGGGPVTVSANFWSDDSLRDRQVGAYIQDSWALSRATLDYGLRWDRESRVGRNNFAPRVGLGIDPTGSGNTKLFANFGIMYSNLNSDFYTFDSPGQQGVPTYTLTNFDQNYNGTLTLRSRTFREIAEMKSPYAVSISGGVEREIFGDAKVTVSYNHRETKDNFKRTTTRLNAIDALTTQRNDGRHTYDGIEFVVRKYMSRGFDLLAHYTLAKSEGDTTDTLSPLQQASQFGYQDWDQRHTVVVSGNIALPTGVRVTVLSRYASGRPYSIVNDLPTVEAAWVDALGRPVGRNNERQPSNATVDLSIGRGFRTAYGVFKPSLEMINLTNRVNITGVSGSFASPGIPIAADTSRVMQLGLAWEF